MQVGERTDSKATVVVAMAVDGHRVVVPADLRVVPTTEFPFALIHFTGSKEHNIRLRQRAIERGLTLNEYALTVDGRALPCATEADIYATLELAYIPPELREDTGEIEAAERDELPKLIEPRDIRGVFHNHTTYSDGTATLEEMALAAQGARLRVLRRRRPFAVADASPAACPPSAVRKQQAEIDALNKQLKGIRILKGIECDILEDGSLDYPDEVLAGFDYVVASVHTHFGMPEEEMTARVCKALATPRRRCSATPPAGCCSAARATRSTSRRCSGGGRSTAR